MNSETKTHRPSQEASMPRTRDYRERLAALARMIGNKIVWGLEKGDTMLVSAALQKASVTTKMIDWYLNPRHAGGGPADSTALYYEISWIGNHPEEHAVQILLHGTEGQELMQKLYAIDEQENG